MLRAASATYDARTGVVDAEGNVLLAETGRVPEDLCRHLGREIARGLEAVHADDDDVRARPLF